MNPEEPLSLTEVFEQIHYLKNYKIKLHVSFLAVTSLIAIQCHPLKILLSIAARLFRAILVLFAVHYRGLKKS